MSCDNRRFLRVPAGDGKPRGIVRLEGSRTLSCEVLNKSSGGYGIGVPVDSAPAFPPGRILVMEVDDLLVRVKVAHAALDPEDDRFLIGLEVIAELEDRIAARQPHVSWLSALWPTPCQGLGGQSTMFRDLVLATLLCSSLLAFTWMPLLIDHLKGTGRKPRNTSSAATFSLPWSWPVTRTIPTMTAASPDPTAVQAGAAASASPTMPAPGPVAASSSGRGSAPAAASLPKP